MHISFDPTEKDEVLSVLRFLRLQHPVLWGEADECPMHGLSVRTRKRLQEHCLCNETQLFSKTREEAVNLLGETAVQEIDERDIGTWK